MKKSKATVPNAKDDEGLPFAPTEVLKFVKQRR